MKRWIFLIFLGTLGAFLFRQFAFEGIYVASESMLPTLPLGGHYFLNKFYYSFNPVQRGDIVVFPDPENSEKDLIKRIVAIPGDSIAFRDKKLIINDVPQNEPYVQYIRKLERLVGDNMDPILIPEGMVFVLGDNRDASRDSRDWKDKLTGIPIPFVPIDKLKGKLKVYL